MNDIILRMYDCFQPSLTQPILNDWVDRIDDVLVIKENDETICGRLFVICAGSASGVVVVLKYGDLELTVFSCYGDSKVTDHTQSARRHIEYILNLSTGKASL